MRSTRKAYTGIGTAVLLVSLGACSDDVLWQAHAAEEARELDLLEDVEVVEMTREEFAAQAQQNADSQDESRLRQYAETYGRLGFFDVDLDLRPVIAGSSSDWVGATYSPNSKRVTLVGEASDDTIVHEFVHALQDQHFDLVAYDDHETSDRFLARRAAVEGDAVLAQYRFRAREENATFDNLDWTTLFDSWRNFSQETLTESSYPLVFLDYVSFVYTYGLEFCAANLTGVAHGDPSTYRATPHDWTRQDELFVSRPPRATQQVLALDIEESTDDPVIDVGLTTVPSSLKSELALVDWDTLGEWYVYLLLLPLEFDQTIADAREISAAWDGDTVLFVRDLQTDEYGVVWTSAWDDPDTALNLAGLMWQIYRTDPPASGFMATASDGETVWIENRGEILVAAKNLAETTIAGLVEAAFNGTAESAPRMRPSMASVINRMRKPHRCHHATSRATALNQ
ncbi:MAG: hypothetical protein MJE77_12000 [Proteobacteria bacterium]|nr:hypothetical protein [Pseudomonadota bacterium]